MEKIFQDNAVSSTDADYVYDKRIAFENADDEAMSNDWDVDDGEEEDVLSSIDGVIDELFPDL